MLLLQFALLNVLCMRHCISDNIVSSINNFSMKNKPFLSKRHLPSLVRRKQFFSQKADINVKSTTYKRTSYYYIAQKERRIKKGFETHDRLLPDNLEQLSRKRRYIIELQDSPSSAELLYESSKPKLRPDVTAIPRTPSDKEKQREKETLVGYPKVALPIQKLFADVGVSFQKYLSPDIFHDKQDGNANSLDIELLTSDGKKLFASSWIKFDKSNLKLYGFPLRGNQNEHLFLLKATNSKGRFAVQEISIQVYALKPVYNHYVHICTTMTLSDYGGSVEQRLRLAKVIINYIFPRRRPEDVWIWKFEEGCIYLTFRHLPRNGQCDFNALQRIEEKIFHDDNVNNAFQQALKGITEIVSLNLTVLDECKKSNVTNFDDGLGWLRDIAPIFILIAVVAVPTVISCIVCKEVRRRQAAMRQLQDRRMKEDREQMLLQSAEYKHECGLDSESDDGQGCTNRPRSQLEEEGKKFFGFSRIADIILPEVVIDTVKQGTEIFNTILPQQTLDSAACEIKAGANKLFPNVTEASSTRFLGTSQYEKENSIERAEFSLTSKVKGMLNFIKSPLDITPMDEKIKFKNESKQDQLKLQERRKLSEIPAEALLPSISSIFGLDSNDGANASLRDIRKSMSNKIRKKFQLIMSASSMSSSKESMEDKEGQIGYQIGTVDVAELNNKVSIPRVQRRKVSQMLELTSDAKTDFSRSVTMLAPKLGARVKPPGQRRIPEGKVTLNITGEDSRRGSKSDCIVNEEGLLHRILHQSKNLISNTKNWRLGQKDSQESIQLKEITRGMHDYDADYKDRFSGHIATDLIEESINKCKHSKVNTGMTPNLSTSCDDMCWKNHMWDCICSDYNNPFRHYKNTSKDHCVENTTNDLAPEFTSESHFLQAAVKNRKLLENTNLCFVNIGEVQLEKELSLIEAADGNWRESDFLSGRQKSNEKQTHAGSLADCFEISNLGKESSLNCRSQVDESISRGLHHYDPESGKWYPAYNLSTDITPAGKMFSLLESFKKNEEKSLHQKSSMHADGIHKGGLHWYNISDEVPERQRETERNRRKTGIDIGSHILFDHISGSRFEQSNEPESNYEINDNRYTGRRKESIGIWTENIYDTDMEDSDACQSSDEETDLQGLINKMQNEKSLHYRYSPNEQYGEEYYLDDTMPSERHREEYNCYSEVMNTIPEGDCNRQDLISGPGPFQRYLKFADDDNNHIQHDGKHLQESRWSHSADPVLDDDSFAVDDDVREYQKSTNKEDTDHVDFETSHDVSNITVEGRRRSSTDSQLHLSTTLLEKVDSPTRSEPGYTTNNKEGVKKQKERRKSFLERQRRVEIPEKTTPCSEQVATPKIHVNPIFVIEERNSKEDIEERRDTDDRFDFATVKRLQSAHDHEPKSSVRMRKLTYSGPFPTANIEAEKFRKQDADIIEHQTKGYLERRRQSLQHITGANQLGKVNANETEPITIQNRAKREETQRRTGMRRFSTPSMDSWTSTPEKYYYDATGDNSISEEDVNCAGLRKDKEKKLFTSGRGRAKEYTQRLLQGVSPKIRRHSTSILGQKCNHDQSGSTVTNTGTFLGKIGEGRLVQTIQTKLGKKDSKAEEPKSPIAKEKKYMEEEKQLKGSPLTAIRNTLFLFSGGK